MTPQTLFELIGYAASILIAISLMMKSLIRLRVINGIGALVFVVYGILIEAYPVAILNSLIVLIDSYYLIRMLKRSDYFTLMEVEPDSHYLQFFLAFHLEDIRSFFPSFSYEPHPNDFVYFVLRNTVPAGLVIIRQEDNKGKILLDYALQDYRDFKIGSFIFDDNANRLLNRGINCLETTGAVPSHERYLRRMGFKQGKDSLYRRELKASFIREKEI